MLFSLKRNAKASCLTPKPYVKGKEAESLCYAEERTNVPPLRNVTSSGVISQRTTHFRKMNVFHIVSNWCSFEQAEFSTTGLLSLRTLRHTKTENLLAALTAVLCSSEVYVTYMAEERYATHSISLVSSHVLISENLVF